MAASMKLTTKDAHAIFSELWCGQFWWSFDSMVKMTVKALNLRSYVPTAIAIHVNNMRYTMLYQGCKLWVILLCPDINKPLLFIIQCIFADFQAIPCRFINIYSEDDKHKFLFGWLQCIMGNLNIHTQVSHNLYFDTLLSSIGKDKQIY